MAEPQIAEQLGTMAGPLSSIGAHARNAGFYDIRKFYGPGRA